MSTSPIGFNNAANSTTPSSVSPATMNLANQNVFLQLLVAQLKYQDPTQPADGTQFVTQLAEFTNVSNTTQMTTDLDAINKNLSTLTTELNPPTNTTGATPKS